jgi:hypothetical protein
MLGGLAHLLSLWHASTLLAPPGYRHRSALLRGRSRLMGQPMGQLQPDLVIGLVLMTEGVID